MHQGRPHAVTCRKAACAMNASRFKAPLMAAVGIGVWRRRSARLAAKARISPARSLSSPAARAGSACNSPASSPAPAARSPSARGTRTNSHAPRPTCGAHGAEVFTHTVRCGRTAGRWSRRSARRHSHFGRIDILVNNAGIIQAGPIEAMTVADFEAGDGRHVLGNALRDAGGRCRRCARGGAARSSTSPRSAARSACRTCCPMARQSSRRRASPRGCAPNSPATASRSRPSRPASCARAAIATRCSRATRKPSSPGSASAIPCPSRRSMSSRRRARSSRRRGAGRRSASSPCPASVAARFHGLFPALTTDMLGIVNRFLPRANGETGHAEPGVAVLEREPERRSARCRVGRGQYRQRSASTGNGDCFRA